MNTEQMRENIFTYLKITVPKKYDYNDCKNRKKEYFMISLN